MPEVTAKPTRIAAACCAAVLLVSLAVPTQGETPKERRERKLATLKQQVKFSEWPGRVKIPRKKVAKHPVAKADLEEYADNIKQVGPRKGNTCKFFLRDASGQQIGRIDVVVCDTPQAAHEALLGYCWGFFSAPIRFTMAENGSPFEVGDVAICGRMPGVPKDDTDKGRVHVVMFSRNNVVAWAGYGNESDLAKIAKLVDDKLVKSLVADGETLEERDARNMEIVKQRLKFDEWGGRVKIPGKKVQEMPLSKADLEEYAHTIKQSNMPKRKACKFFLRDESRQQVGRIDVVVCDTVQAAHNRLLASIWASAIVHLTMTEKGSPFFEVGDISFCARIIPPPKDDGSKRRVRGVSFTRNNAHVVVSHKNESDLLKVAKLVDDKLVKSLVDEDKDE